MDSNKDKFNLLMLFAVVYPILPSYFRISGVMVQIAFIIIVSFSLMLFSKWKIPKVSDEPQTRGLVKITYIWAAFFVLISIYYKNTYGVITNLFPWFIIFPFYIKEVNTKQKFTRILDCIILVGVIVSVLGIIEGITSFNVFNYINTDDYSTEVGLRLGYNRIFSFSSHPISLSLYCLFIDDLILFRIFSSDTKEKHLFVIAYVIVLAAAVFTFSRSSIICIFINLFILLAMCGYKAFVNKMIKIVIFMIFACFVFSIVFPDRWKMITDSMVLVLAVISDSYAKQLAELGYQWDPSGVADRLDLWKIVFEKMPGYYILGHGPSTLLSDTYVVNSLGNRIEKTSIEVTPLLLLFRFGIFAALVEEIRNIKQIIVCIKLSSSAENDFEEGFSFNKLCAVLFITYFFALLTVNQTDTLRVYFLISALFIAYNRNCLFDKNRNVTNY